MSEKERGKKFNIKNRKGENVVVVVEERSNSAGLVFVMHGLSGNKDQGHVQAFADAFRKENFTVVLFDTTNTFGESDGDFYNATITNYYEDLEDVISWAKGQDWYKEPFWLTGHSLGGICTALYAERYSDEVKALAPISAVVSGKLNLEHHEENDPEMIEEWREKGRIITPSSRPGIIKELPWSHMEDRLKYDLLPESNMLTMPVLLIVGEKDEGTPPEHIKLLFEAISHQNKEYHVIEGAPHTFKKKEHLEEIKSILSTWIKKVDGQI